LCEQSIFNGGQPAYTKEEIEEARAIAEQDNRVGRFVKLKEVFPGC
jgi:hypothetical protein